MIWNVSGNLGEVYVYDSADDGPECDIITRILASHALYIPGKEAELLRFQEFVNQVARRLYDNPYSRLSLKRKTHVANKVIRLHLQDNLLKGGFAWAR